MAATGQRHAEQPRSESCLSFKRLCANNQRRDDRSDFGMNDSLLIAGAGLLGGAINAVAGGASFVTLPAMIAAGVPSLSANASSTVALLPSALTSAYAYRHDFQGFDGVSFKAMALISII